MGAGIGAQGGLGAPRRCCFPFIHSRTFAHGMVPPTFRAARKATTKVRPEPRQRNQHPCTNIWSLIYSPASQLCCPQHVQPPSPIGSTVPAAFCVRRTAFSSLGVNLYSLQLAQTLLQAKRALNTDALVNSVAGSRCSLATSPTVVVQLSKDLLNVQHQAVISETPSTLEQFPGSFQHVRVQC